MNPVLKYPTRFASEFDASNRMLCDLFPGDTVKLMNPSKYAKSALNVDDKASKIKYFTDKGKERYAEYRKEIPATKEEFQYLTMYTSETDPERKQFNVYSLVNDAMARGDAEKLQQHKDPLYGTLSILRKMPYCSHSVVYRAISGRIDYSVYAIGNELMWVPFTSTSYDFNGIQKFRSIGGTVFVITGEIPGHDISKLSAEAVTEREVLIEPCFCFRVLHVERAGTPTDVDIIFVEGLPSKRAMDSLLPRMHEPPGDRRVLRAATHTYVLEHLLGAIARGNTADEFALGGMFMEGEILTRNLDLATSWFNRAAGRHHPEAAFMLGKMKIMGDTGDAKPLDGKVHLEEGIKAGRTGKDVDLLLKLAEKLDRVRFVRDPVAKDREMQEVLRLKLEICMILVAGTYDIPGRFISCDKVFGETVEFWGDYRHAQRFAGYCAMGKKAEEGDAGNQLSLAELYMNDLFMTGRPCYALAYKWYQRAGLNNVQHPNLQQRMETAMLGIRAEQGDRAAMLELAQRYEAGVGVGPKPALADEWRRKASGF